jgi:hypothetical protein
MSTAAQSILITHACDEMVYRDVCTNIEDETTRHDHELDAAWANAFKTYHCPGCMFKCVDCERM